MLNSAITAVVTACTRHAWPVVAAALLVGLIAGGYSVAHFAINTDINTLISPDLPWRQRELALEKAFPERTDLILVVVQAPTPEQAGEATTALAGRLSGRKDLFRSVQDTSGSAFFRRNGLIFAPIDEVQQTAEQLAGAAPIIGALAGDPSLRGLTQALSFGLQGAQMGQFRPDDLARPLTLAAETVETATAGKPVPFSWQVLLDGRPASPSELRRFIEVRPVLDFAALEPGRAASDAIRQAAADLDLAKHYGATVRLTGPVPIADEEFATVQHGALLNGIATIIVVLIILRLALRSPKIIAAVFVNLIVGLAITAALGLIMVGALNLISIAFAVLFVGLGVDFAIQFSVRYRAERHDIDNLPEALARTAASVGAPLTLAAGAVTAAFLSFLPTDYRGVSELGQIAGVGMLIAYVTSITLLPALLAIFNPPGEPEPLGYARLAPVDRFLERHRIGVIAGTALVVLGGLPLLFHLTFDFNPLNLRSPKVESVATFLELRGDPAIGANSINVLAPSLPRAEAEAKRLAELPEVAKTTTLASFVPDDQERKLALIEQARQALAPALAAPTAKPPSDGDNVAALRSTALSLEQAAAAGAAGPDADAKRRLARALTRLAQGDEATRARAQAAFVAPLQTALAGLRDLLQAQATSLETLPDELVRAWTTPDGRARIELLPKGDANDNDTLRRFARAVLAVAPTAIGGPISILKSGETIVDAFIQAGAWALISIAILLWIVLRRFTDVLLTLIPLLVAGVLTLELCVLIGLPLNFANIIALPLLLGVGVAFKIYYIMAWRDGQTSLLQSSLTRAVIWSALTTATAFGSLWLSNHPGTSSMGKLMALSLATTLCAAVLFQPALMGRPRNASDA